MRYCIRLFALAMMLACLRVNCFLAPVPAAVRALSTAARNVPAAALLRAKPALFAAPIKRAASTKTPGEGTAAQAAGSDHKFAPLGRVLSDFQLSAARVKSIYSALKDFESMDELVNVAAPYAHRSPGELAARLEEKFNIKPVESDIVSSALLQLAGQTQQRAYKAKGRPPSMFICHSKVVGTTFQPSIPWETLKAGDLLELKHEANPHDANAVAVYHKDTKLGYIGKELVQAQQLHVDTSQYWAEITNITGGGDKNHGCNIKIFFSSENGKKPASASAASAPAKPVSTPKVNSFTPAAGLSRAPGKPAYAAGAAKPAFSATSKPVYNSKPAYAAPGAKTAKRSDPHFVTFSKVVGVSSYPVPWDQIQVDDRLDLIPDERKNQVTIVHQKTQQKMGYVNPALVEKFNMLEDIKSKRYDWWAVVNQLTGGNGRQQGCNIDLCSSRGSDANK